ncbi:MAG: TonB-dependent receptor [Bacteroidota bacterium]
MKGKVVGAENRPIEDAIVGISGIEVIVFSDEKGEFLISGISSGSYIIDIHRLGYSEYHKEVKILSDTILIISLGQALELEEVIVEDEFLGSEIVTLNRETLDEQEIQRTRGESLANTLKEIPGVQTLRTGSRVSKPVIHGLHSSRLLILNNGLRHESQSWGQDHAPEIDPFLAKNLSVVKGAASVRYGSNALSGVVIANPNRLPFGQSEIGGEVNIVGNSNGRSGSFSGILESGFNENWAWRVNGSVKRGGDLRAPDYFLTNTGFREYSGSAALGYDDGKLSLNGYFSTFFTEVGILAAITASNDLDALDRAINTEPPARTDPDFSYRFNNPRQEVRHNLFKLEGAYDLDVGKLKWTYGWQNNARKEFDVRRSSLSQIPSLNLELSTQSLEVEFEPQTKNGFENHIGISYLNQRNRNIPGTQRSNFIPNFILNSFGAFYIANKHFDAFHIEAGLRYDYKSYTSVIGFNSNLPNNFDEFYFDEFDFGNVTGTLGIGLHLNSYSSFSSNVGVAWRPPNAAELYSFGIKQTAGALEYGLLWGFEGNNADANTQFQVREFDNVGVDNEVSYKWTNTYNYSKNDFELSATAYVNWIDNYIFIRPGGVTVSQRGTLPYYFYDQTNALFTGIEFKTNYTGFKDWIIDAKADFVYAEDITNSAALPLIPAPTFSFGLRKNHEIQNKKLTFFYGARLYGAFRQFEAPRVIAPLEFEEILEQDIDVFSNDASAFDFIPAPDGYALVKLEAGFEKLVRNGQSIKFLLSMDNLFNTEFRDYTNRLKYFADEQGRNISIRINYNF